ncbi:MAG TPA: VCBS repeat-containing protein, partial [Pyrinomonadaceae bacterium]|nr:VCBS repeat-containing protein [Pyrinomonadaceae bacterium]
MNRNTNISRKENKVINVIAVTAIVLMLQTTAIFASAVRPFGVGLLANGTMPGGTYTAGGGGFGAYITHFNDVSADGSVVLFSSNYPAAAFVPDVQTTAGGTVSNQFSRNLITGEIKCLSCGFYVGAGAVVAWGGHSGKITPDGRYAVYAGPNYAAGNFAIDEIFLIDLQTGTRTLASISPAGIEGNARSARPVVSANGRYVAFNSAATNLITGYPSTSTEQVFVRDTQSGVTYLASHAAGSTTEPGNAFIDANQPLTISANGRFVVWTSPASNYSPFITDTNGANDVFYFDVFSSGSNIGCASSTSSSIATGNGASTGGVVSAASASFPPKVVFNSLATNLNTADTNPRMDTYLFDGSSSVKLVSVGTGGSAGNAASSGFPGISSNGRYVIFASTSSDLSASTSEPSMTTSDVFVRDMQTNITKYVSLNGSGQPSSTNAGAGLNPSASFHKTHIGKSITDDGRYISFVTAEPMSVRDTGSTPDLYVRDTKSEVTILATLARSATGGQNGVVGPYDDFGFAMSARSLYFSLGGNNLVAGDTSFSNNSKVFASKISLLAQRSISDFNDDGITDPAVFRAGEGLWYELLDPINSGYSSALLGEPGTTVVPGDYDGDRISDRAVFTPSLGRWEILESSAGQLSTRFLGASTDVVAPADFDGDGRTDLAYFRPSTGGWFISQSSSGLARGVRFGISGDIPVPGDFDGDNKADVAVFRPSTGDWWILNSSTGSITGFHWGTNGDKPVVGDFDGDGRSDA